MNKLIAAMVPIALLLSPSAARAGDVYVVDNGEGKKPVVMKKDQFVLGEVPAMGPGKPNVGFSYTTAFELAGAGIQVARGQVKPGGKVAAHEGPQQYLLYVIRGSGKLTCLDKAGNKTAEIAYKPDDLILFQPNTLHEWVNGVETFDFLGIDLPVPRR
jgi:quercetin dioxygenase-like cupin family protein